MESYEEQEEIEYTLEVNNLTIKFDTDRGEVTAADDISFKIRKGETLGIVGESGSGKSVTALSLMDLIPQPPGRIVSGEIFFRSLKFGRIDLLKTDRKTLRALRGGELAMIFQEPMSSLNPVFTCGSQVMEAIREHTDVSWAEAKKRTLELFRRVKLPRPEAAFKAYPHELSGGQKQRVMIAMALSCSPSLLIADEPTTALDVTVQHRILEIMQELREDINTTILFISHDLGVIGEIADRVMVMFGGKIVEEGDVWDIFSNPSHPYTKGLLACRPRLDIKLRRLPVVNDFMVTDERGNMMEVEGGKFNSVGQAIMMNFRSSGELKEQYEGLIAQPPILQVKNLNAYYPGAKNWFGRNAADQHAVKEVSFDVYPGETLGLVGESGCGKSTLGRCIVRLHNDVNGQILFENQNILELPPRRLREMRRDIQIIFQDPMSSLNPRITIGEAIMEPMRIHKILENDRQRRNFAVELLETVNLSGTYFNRYPHEFSGGQRQRICIARTLALRPKFIICDESVSALDVSVQSQVLNLLNDLKKKYQLTYIFISHDLSVVKFISDRIMVMHEGRIEEVRFGEDLYRTPESEHTKTLIEAIPRGSLEDVRRAMFKRKAAKGKMKPNQPK